MHSNGTHTLYKYLRGQTFIYTHEHYIWSVFTIGSYIKLNINFSELYYLYTYVGIYINVVHISKKVNTHYLCIRLYVYI